MVADPEIDAAGKAGEEGADGEGGHRPGKGGVRRLIAGVTRLVDLQWRIWLAQLQLATLKIAVAAGLFLGAAAFGILAVIFLCIGVFHVLTEVLHLPPWAAYLIFGGILGVTALVMALVAVRRLSRTVGDEAKEGEK